MSKEADDKLKALSDALREECQRLSVAHKADIYLSDASMGIRTEMAGKKIVSANSEDRWEYTIERPGSAKSKRRYIVKVAIHLLNITR